MKARYKYKQIQNELKRFGFYDQKRNVQTYSLFEAYAFRKELDQNQYHNIFIDSIMYKDAAEDKIILTFDLKCQYISPTECATKSIAHLEKNIDLFGKDIPDIQQFLNEILSRGFSKMEDVATALGRLVMTGA